MAVSRFGSSSDFATRYALDKFGLVPDKDVTILEIGSQPARFAALESGKMQAAMVAIPLRAGQKPSVSMRWLTCKCLDSSINIPA